METETKFLGQHQETPDTASFYFAKPEGFNFQAGQFMFFTIPHPQVDERGQRRHFTIASSPTEEKIMFTTKFSNPTSSYKQALKSLPEGTAVAVRSPNGEFILPEDKNREIVLLGGGIGVTPFRSMVKLATDTHLPTTITLIYASKTAGDIVYRQEFDEWAGLNANLKAIYTVDQAELGWSGQTGRLTGEMIRQFVPDLGRPLYYICGPAGMIEAYTQILSGIGVSPDQIRTENFSGY